MSPHRPVCTLLLWKRDRWTDDWEVISTSQPVSGDTKTKATEGKNGKISSVKWFGIQQLYFIKVKQEDGYGCFMPIHYTFSVKVSEHMHRNSLNAFSVLWIFLSICLYETVVNLHSPNTQNVNQSFVRSSVTTLTSANCQTESIIVWQVRLRMYKMTDRLHAYLGEIKSK